MSQTSRRIICEDSFDGLVKIRFTFGGKDFYFHQQLLIDNANLISSLPEDAIRCPGAPMRPLGVTEETFGDFQHWLYTGELSINGPKRNLSDEDKWNSLVNLYFFSIWGKNDVTGLHDDIMDVFVSGYKDSPSLRGLLVQRLFGDGVPECKLRSFLINHWITFAPYDEDLGADLLDGQYPKAFLSEVMKAFCAKVKGLEEGDDRIQFDLSVYYIHKPE